MFRKAKKVQKKINWLGFVILSSLAAFTTMAKGSPQAAAIAAIGGLLFLFCALYITFAERRAKLRVGSDCGYLIYKLAGTVTLGEGANALRQQLEKDFAAGRFSVILDLTKVVKMDPVAVCEIDKYAQRARLNGGDIQCFGLNLRDTLILTRVGKAFAVHEDQIAAIAHFPSASAARK